MKKLWNMTRLVWLNVGFYTGFLVMTATGMLFVTIPLYYGLRFFQGLDKGHSIRWMIWLDGQAWTKLLGAFVPLRIENCERPLPQPCIVTPNHQSFFDTYCFGFTPSYNVVFAVRAWPFKMPFYGMYMRHADYLNTEDGSANDFLKRGKAILAKGTSIAVFPEGTRSLDGNMRRFSGGAFHLAAETGVPVVPMCIEGTGTFLRKGSFLLRPASIFVRVLDPIWPEQLPVSREELPLALRHAVKDRLQQTLLELRGGKTTDIPSQS
ncbi:MAG: 1-acyl-sn-glycerol-3-phosphate acyltransferase [Deltaproteobacteria bacterium]|jgi:1-acyl-sn-glycerol-3-phosphate acyltransferase|nr:1-acyl-sn-glycerol-3-phosphate acyltransferase [Deltaproteobacteria bacterium]